MAVTLRVEDTSTTVDLSAAYKPRGYTPKPTPDYEEWTSETGTFEFDTALGTITTAVQDLGRLFIKAREWNTKRVGEPVYVKLKLQDADDLYRSELATGLVSPRDGALDYPATNAPYMLFDISWTRKNYWEHDTEQTLPAQGFNIVAGTTIVYNTYEVNTRILNEGIGTAGGGTVFSGTLLNTPIEAYLDPPVVNYNVGGALSGTFVAGTGATSGGTIGGGSIQSGTINYSDGVWSITFTAAPSGTIKADYDYGYGNYIHVQGTSIVGDMIAPIKLSIAGSATSYIVGSTYGVDPTSSMFFTQCETGKNSVRGTVVANSFASQGSALQYEGTTDYGDYYITRLSITNIGNEYYVPVLRFAGTPDSVGGTFSIYNHLWRTELGRSASTVLVRDIFNVQTELFYQPENYQNGTAHHTNWYMFPPLSISNQNNLPGEGNGAVLGIACKLYDAAAGTTIDMDTLQLYPTAGGFGVYNLPYDNDKDIVIDGINERVYFDNGANRSPDFTNEYEYPRVAPNQTSRFVVAWSRGFDTNATESAEVTATYRPRKRSI